MASDSLFTAHGFETEATGFLLFRAARVEERGGALVPFFDEATALAVARGYDAAVADTWGRNDDEDAVSRYNEADRAYEFYDRDDWLSWSYRSERGADGLVSFPCWGTWVRADGEPTPPERIAGTVYGIDIPTERAIDRFGPADWAFEPVQAYEELHLEPRAETAERAARLAELDRERDADGVRHF